MAISINDVIKKNPDIACSKLDDEEVLLNIETGDYYTLNNTGSVLWEMLDSTEKVSELVVSFAQRYSLEKDKAEVDVLRLLNDLVAEGLVSPE
jgi:myo-inositol-1-phosphate synthase